MPAMGAFAAKKNRPSAERMVNNGHCEPAQAGGAISIERWGLAVNDTACTAVSITKK